MTTFRIILFSIVAALLLYAPFYYFSPIYRQWYIHLPLQEINPWVRMYFDRHSGIQIYIAFIMMFLAIGLTAFLEYIYLKFIPPSKGWMVLAICVEVCLLYLWSIEFHPPMAAISVNGQGILFIAIAISLAFIFGRFFDREWMNVLLLLLLFSTCMIPVMWSCMEGDYFYILSPALRTLKGYALNHSSFLYDHLLSFLAMAWMKCGLPIGKFYIVTNISFVAFFAGIFVLAKNLFFDKRLAVYFILSLVLIKVYGLCAPITDCPQVSPMRLDMWLVLLGLAYWKGPQHWTVGLTLGIFLIFHHAFGMIYSISYMLLVATFLVFNISKFSLKQYLPNACMMICGFLINQFFISSNGVVPALNFLKYNEGTIPIHIRSFFWYVPMIVSTTVLLLWKSRAQLPQRYFQMGIFLVLLTIGNLLYFFERSHENNLINIAGSLWLLFFMLIDLIVYQLPQQFSSIAKKVFVPTAGVLIVGIVAYFYSATAVDRIKAQAANLPKIAELFTADKGVDLDLNRIRAVTRGNPDIVFLSPGYDFEYYYYGGYVPTQSCPLENACIKADLMRDLNNELSQGADIIVPLNEYEVVKENIPLLNAKYTYRAKDFILFSNNQPAI